MTNYEDNFPCDEYYYYNNDCSNDINYCYDADVNETEYSNVSCDEFEPSKYLQNPLQDLQNYRLCDRPELIELNCDPNLKLPYIYLEEIDAKMMIDTGSMRSFLSPRKAYEYFSDSIRKEQFQVNSTHASSRHDEVIEIPLLPSFRNENWHKFYLYDVDDRYDGLIGNDLLQQLGAEIVAIAIAIDEEESTASRNGRKNVRKWGVYPIWRKRRYEGEFFTLCRDLPDNEDKFFGCFRISKDNFQILLHKLSAALKRQQTKFQSPITPEERLAVCISNGSGINNVEGIGSGICESKCIGAGDCDGGGGGVLEVDCDGAEIVDIGDEFYINELLDSDELPF
ncbi:unnamed protein product, partial [Brenthis ino]